MDIVGEVGPEPLSGERSSEEPVSEGSKMIMFAVLCKEKGEGKW